MSPETICPYCQFSVDTEEANSVICPGCNTLYHAACWEESQVCSIISCDIENDIKTDFPAIDVTHRSTEDQAEASEDNMVEKTLYEDTPDTKDKSISNESDISDKEENYEIAPSSSSNGEEKATSFYDWFIYVAAGVVIIIILMSIIKINSDSTAAEDKREQKEVQEVAKEEAVEKIKEDDTKVDMPLVWNGGSYEGELKNDKPHGQGKWEGPDGEEYKGSFKKGFFDGYGVLKKANGNVYDGEWSNGVMNGFGTYIWLDGRKYEGEWESGQRHGIGQWTHPDGRDYVGGWKNDLVHGEGVYHWPDGESYVGEYKRGEKEGYGKWILPDGTVYEGEFTAGYPDGKGVKFYPDGTYIEGEWIDGEYVKPAFTPEKSIYVEAVPYEHGYYTGYMLDGLPHGEGFFIGPTGDVLDVSWIYGVPDGTGVFYEANGTERKVFFDQGVLIEP